MGGPSLPHRARTLVGLLLLSGAAASPGLQAPARAQEAMVQWRQQIQNSFGGGSIPSPASYGTLAPGTAPAAAPTPRGTSPPTPSASRSGTAAGAASIPAPATAATTCPPLRVSQMARIRAGRPVRVMGGNCLMEFN
jgi:hypothetical protein